MKYKVTYVRRGNTKETRDPKNITKNTPNLFCTHSPHKHAFPASSILRSPPPLIAFSNVTYIGVTRPATLTPPQKEKTREKRKKILSLKRKSPHTFFCKKWKEDVAMLFRFCGFSPFKLPCHRSIRGIYSILGGFVFKLFFHADESFCFAS